MRQRAHFVLAATRSGWDWLVEVSNHVGLAALIVLAATGVSVFGAWRLPHWWYGLLILFAFYVLLFGEGAFRVWRAVADTRVVRALPSREVEFGEPFRSEPRAFHRQTPAGTQVGTAFTPIVLPVTARNGNIVNCRATVEFKGESFEKGMRGRWENREQPKKIYGADLSYLDRITLLRDEDDAIAIAVQHETDPHIYMLCNRSWEMFLHLGQDGLRHPEYLVPGKEASVRVTVRGDDMEDCVYEFVLAQGDRYVWNPVFEDEIGRPLTPFLSQHKRHHRPPRRTATSRVSHRRSDSFEIACSMHETLLIETPTSRRPRKRSI
jgi:hypothetical protein